ncbi:MAG: superoxide dismutase, partial [Hymenobacteraceae bacterium]|nr:superoxide dismutase [Hymenobacteraceae bacterium]
MAFDPPARPYPVTALEPHIDRQTMEIHHGKHHQAYVTNLNNAVAGTELEGKTLEEIVKLGAALPPAVRNNGGGHWNHSLFWQVIGPTAGGEPSGPVAGPIAKAFGSYGEFKEGFTKSA